MESQKDKVSEGGDLEDIPSDFFDDFNKAEFMDGLSVIDSWDDEDNSKRRINMETLDSVKDLRELIENKEDEKSKQEKFPVKFDKRFKWTKENSSVEQRTDSGARLDDYIKPGSRRDPGKTNEAIKKDKEVKVKEYLAKHLEASDDIRPPGTELDDFYNEKKRTEKKKSPVMYERLPARRRSREYPLEDNPASQRGSRHYYHSYNHRGSPGRVAFQRRSPRRSPYRQIRRSPPRNWNHSPPRKYKRFSPQRSPRRHSPPRRSPRRSRYSKSPQRRSYRRSRSASAMRDSFLYPHGVDPVTNYPSSSYTSLAMAESDPREYSGSVPEYSYPQGPPYADYGGSGYDYGIQPEVPMAMPIPQPVPAPVMDQVDVSVLNPMSAPISTVKIPSQMINPISLSNLMNPVPAMVPPPSQVCSSSHSASTPQALESTTAYDPLAQLVAEGKLSKEDYLKLAPNKGVSSNLDLKTRMSVLTRCNQALGKLKQLLLPNRLYIQNHIIGQEPKYLAPKYCSPLKRQAAVEFQFTKSSGRPIQENKQLVDSIIATIGLDKIVARPKKKTPKNMKDAAVQTTKPYCDVCEIRESTRIHHASTSIDPDQISSSVHTQVVDQDLISSKSIFNPTGSVSDSAPISIAHLTPAQLVSQLAARAKTLKQTSEPVQSSGQYAWRNAPPNNYDNRAGPYQNNYNYRY